MTKLILMIILAGVAVGACVDYQIRTHQSLPSTEFELVCEKVEEVFDTTCEGLQEPDVVYTQIIGQLGAIGAYMPGEYIIFIDPMSTEPYSQVIIHEMTHYVLLKLNITSDRCDSEAIARKWESEITGNEMNPNWRRIYAC